MPEPEAAKMRSSPRILPHGSAKVDGTTTAKSGGDLTETLKLPVGPALENALTRQPSSDRSETRKESQRAAQFDVCEQRWELIKKAIGPRYAECTVENFDTRDTNQKFASLKVEAVDQVRAYLSDLKENIGKGKNVLFFGPKGTGKDHLMVGMLREAVYVGANCRWWDGMTLYAELRSCVREKRSEVPLLKKLIEAHVVAISDPLPPRGASVSEFIADFMFRLVDGRYRLRRSTWMTMNVSSKEEAEERMAPQIHDRLRDFALQVRCNWESYRRPES
jgi:DNA replication protein DnaC